MEFKWVDGFKIEAIIEDDSVRIIANKEGLISLASHLIELSADRYYKGYDFHLDNSNSLEENSKELIFQKG